MQVDHLLAFICGNSTYVSDRAIARQYDDGYSPWSLYFTTW